MTLVLTWKFLDQDQTAQCLLATDLNAVRAVLHRCKNPHQSFPLSRMQHDTGQVRILLDLYGHAVLFAKAEGMSTAKTSTLIGILHTLHETSMADRLTRAASYDLLRTLMVRHSIARPPYSAAVFSLADVRALDEYLMDTYYRHYKMYYFCFVPKEVATIRMVPLGALTELPPTDLPALNAAMTEADWKKKVEAEEQTTETAKMEEMLRYSEELEEQRRREAGLNDPSYTDGIREQLEMIRSAVALKSTDRLDILEAKLAAIEARVDETVSKSRPTSKSTTRKK